MIFVEVLVPSTACGTSNEWKRTLTIENDCTGTEAVGNYIVRIDGLLIALIDGWDRTQTLFALVAKAFSLIENRADLS